MTLRIQSVTDNSLYVDSCVRAAAFFFLLCMAGWLGVFLSCLLEIYFLTLLLLDMLFFASLSLCVHLTRSINLYCWHLADSTKRSECKNFAKFSLCMVDKICEPFEYADKAIHVFDFNLFYVWIGAAFYTIVSSISFIRNSKRDRGEKRVFLSAIAQPN